MSYETETGEIWQRQWQCPHHRTEWTIKNIFSYTEAGQYRQSPKFFILDSEWYLELYPNGLGVPTKEWMGLYLVRENGSTSNVVVNFRFGIKKLDGNVEKILPALNHAFSEETDYWGFPKWLNRTDLLERKSELVPSDSLTITCSFKVKDGSSEATSGLEKLSDDFKNMFLTRKGCDASLVVQKEVFPISKSIMAARSPVFDAMFEADMQEKNTGVVDIVDCHPGAFKDFLVYIYCGKFEYTSGKIFDLYTIAHTYDVELLKSECVAFMMGNLSVLNVADAYAIGHRFHEEELKKKSQDFFNENFADVICNDKWESLLQEKQTFVSMLLKGMAEHTLMKKKVKN